MSQFYLRKLGRYALPFLSFLCLWSAGKSQKYFHIDETFTGFPSGPSALPYNGWSNVIQAGDFSFDTWRFNNPGGRTIAAPAAGQVAVFDSDWNSINGGDEDVSLVTPVFDTRGYDNVWVKFDHQHRDLGSTWAVEAFDGTSWVNVYSSSQGVGWPSDTYQTDSFDITTWCADIVNARVRFRYQGNYDWWWLVDNVQVFSNVQPNNTATLNAVMIGGQCGASSDNVMVTVRNVSDASLSNIPVKADVNGTIGGSPINSTFSGTVTGPLAPGQITTINLGPFSTLAGGTISYKGYTQYAGDPDAANDEVTVNNYNIFGTPSLPTPTNATLCGAGSVTLNGGVTSGNAGVWYNGAASTTPIASGGTYTTPFLLPPTVQTYYVSQARTSTQKTRSTGFGGNNTFLGAPGGNMFTVNTFSNLIIDSFAVNVNTTSNVDVSVYYKTGSYIGFETDPTAWTLLGTKNVVGQGAGVRTYVDLPDLAILAGQTYSIYVRSSYEIVFTGGGSTFTNADMEISTGIAVSGLFSGVALDFTWNGRLYYRTFCETNRVAVTATVNPAPSFSDFTPVTPFAGTIDAGTLANPDIVAPPDIVNYDIVTPAGFSNANYGPAGTWVFSNVDVRTLGGTPLVLNTDYSVNNPGANNGRLIFKPTNTFIDSTVRIRITIKRNDNNCDTVIERIVYLAPRPTSDFSGTITCDKTPLTFSNLSSIIPSGSVSYKWDFGDGTTSIYVNPTKTFPAYGTYNVKLVVTSNLGYKDSVTKTVTVKQLPTPDFNFVNTCDGSPVPLTDNSFLPAGTVTYTWDYGDGSALGSGATTSRQYAMPGLYTVKLTVDVNGCVASKSKVVTQGARSNPDFTFTPTQCDNADVTFTNTSTPPPFGSVSYIWKFGDGSVSSDGTPQHAYNVFNTYDVTLVGSTDLGCQDSITKSVALRESPKAGFTNTGASCSNDPVSFTNTTNVPASSTNTYEWEFGDGNTSSAQDPMHQFTSPGTYNVMLKATSTNGCVGQTTSSITISQKPIANFSATDVCLGEPTVFNNASVSQDSSSLTYAWNFDNSSTSGVQSPTVTYSAAGTYNVSLKVTLPNGCSDSVVNPVKVNAVPVPVILFASQLSFDGAFNFTTTTVGTGYTYHWRFGDGGSSRSKDTSYRYIDDGLRVVTLTITSPEGCMSVATDTIMVNRLGVKQATGLENKVNVYPNPSAGRFVIDLSNANSEILNMSVTDMLGRTIADGIKASAGFAEVDLGAQAAGIYYLNIFTAGGTHSIKLSISR